jgi:UDP-N-acetylmuramate--alanine ligase
MYRKKVHLHFVGIGGIGMSGIAKILRYQGYTISGCDIDLDQKSIHDLKHLGCAIYEGNNTPSCHDESIDIVVYSSAIHAHNPEIRAAQARAIPTIPRALMLAELMRTKYSIAIAGSHGKTTTTSLISHILIETKKDPTVIIGGHLKTISTNAQFGSGDFLVAEADESDKSLVHLQATLAVVTNISPEHLDVYRDVDDIKNTFKHFLNNLPFYGKAFLCIDNVNVRSLLPLSHLKIVKYGLDAAADIRASDVVLEPHQSTCCVYYQQQELGKLTIPMPGNHNVQNALAALAVCLELEIPFADIKKALANFKGVERRFSFNGIYKGAEIFNDYGHHPEEIKNTLEVAYHRKRAAGKLTVVFQPHRFTRTYALWDLFIDTLVQSPIDHLIITDIYAASEPPLPEITAQNLAKAIQKRHPRFSVTYVPYEEHFSLLKWNLDAIVAPDDLILFQGAGNVYKCAHVLTQQKK